MNNANKTVTVGNASVEIISGKGYGTDATEWQCRATLCGEWHGALSGKSYKSEAGAVRAATKWATETNARHAVEKEQAAAIDAAPKAPTPEWLKGVFSQLENGDVATVQFKL